MSDAHATPSPAPGASVALDAVPRIGSGFRLQFEPAQQCQVLLYPEGMVKMNGSAGAILERCDGVRSVAAIVADLEATFGAQGLAKDVLAFLEIAQQKRWVSLG
jgi:pyrroloquinoline quinone biosynthesis protein D